MRASTIDFCTIRSFTWAGGGRSIRFLRAQRSTPSKGKACEGGDFVPVAGGARSDRRHPLRLRRPDREQPAADGAVGGRGAAALPRVVRPPPLPRPRAHPHHQRRAGRLGSKVAWRGRRLSPWKMLDQKENKGELMPYLANVNVRWCDRLDNLREMRFEDNELDTVGLKYGDIVMCEGGEPGRCALWKEQLPRMMIQKAIHRIRAHPEVSYLFLYYCLRHKGQFLTTGKFLARQVLDRRAGEQRCQLSGLSLVTQAVIEKQVTDFRVRPNTMNCLLDHHSGELFFPNRATARLSPFAHDYVAVLRVRPYRVRCPQTAFLSDCPSRSRPTEHSRLQGRASTRPCSCSDRAFFQGESRRLLLSDFRTHPSGTPLVIGVCSWPGKRRRTNHSR